MVSDSLRASILDDIRLLACLDHIRHQFLNQRGAFLNEQNQISVALRRHTQLVHLPYLVQEDILVARSDRHDVVHRQLAQYSSLDLYLLDVLLPLNLGTGLQLFGGIDIHLAEEVDACLVEVAIEHQWCRSLAVQASLLCLLAPLVGVTVTIKADSLALAN